MVDKFLKVMCMYVADEDFQYPKSANTSTANSYFLKLKKDFGP